MARLDIKAETDSLDKVTEFIDEQLEAADCSMKAQMQIELAVEEIFVNIAHYAYTPSIGMAGITVETQGDSVLITFEDSGVPYDPLAKEDPDVTLSAQDRSVGGLGIFMVKKSMDDVRYAYIDGKNILTLEKKLR
ncbi:MAG: ATP-binding protein [Ruminococcus sp.]|nr:ATP-binding protein [Ruminococcus sp.]